MKRLFYCSELAVKSMLRRPKTTALVLLSLTCTMLVPLVMTAAIYSLSKQSERLKARYPTGSTAALLTTAKLENTTEAFADFDGSVAVTAGLTSEYLISINTSGGESGLFARFEDVIALDSAATKLICPELPSDIFDELGCVLDPISAKRFGLKLGDTLMIRGIEYKIKAISSEQSNFIGIGYDTLRPGDHAHTLYFLPDCGFEPTDKELRSYVKAKLNSTPELIALDELFLSKAESANSYFVLLFGIFSVFLICGCANQVRIKRGELELCRYEQAISLAVGSTEAELAFTHIISDLILLPLALALDCIVLALLNRFTIILPFTVKITPVVLISVAIIMLAVQTLISCISIRRLMSTSPAQLLKEG